MTIVHHRVVSSVIDWVKSIILTLLHLCVQTLSNLSRLDETTRISRVIS